MILCFFLNASLASFRMLFSAKRLTKNQIYASCLGT